MSVTAAQTANLSSQTFLTAFVAALIVAGIYLAIFMLIRNRFRAIYNPRSYLVPPKKRITPLPHGLLSWIPAILKEDARQIISKNGLDAYVFVRFLYLMMELFIPYMILTWVVIMPIDAAGSKGTDTGIEAFTFGNVGLSETPRYAAHLIVAWILTFYTFYLIKRELAAYIILRQDFLMSREHSRLPQSKTVLVTGVAKEYLTVEALTKFCSVLPGGVQRVWIARKLGDLPDIYDRRMKACGRLESAETGLLRAAAKLIFKAEQARKKGKEPKGGKEAHLPPSTADLEADPSIIARYVSGKNRPHHKLGPFGLWGKKVDSIDWAREEIETTNKLLAEGHEILIGPGAQEKYPAESAAFIAFNTQIAAHMFAQCLAHHAPLRMSARYIEVGQDDVIWSNLSINPYQAKARYAISWLFTIGLIVLWAFPVAFVGLISNVSSLCLTVKWMAWLCKLPSPVNGIIQGALPPVALSVLFILLPIILRLFARFQGIPLKTQIELSLMTRYFIFLVIHGFLIVTLASGLINAIPAITKDPSSAVTLLATKLPGASTFFLTYFVTTSLGGASGSILQIVTLIVYYVKLILLGSTPRSVYGIKFGLGSVQWGTLFPNMTLLTVIGITYAVIAPLVAGFALLAFFLFWFTYKYLFLWVLDTPPASETGGLFYPKALSHIFVGLYISQVCLAGLFFLAQDKNGKNVGIPEGAIMIVLIVFTIFYQLTLNSGYEPLIAYLPLSVAAKIDEIQGLGEFASSSTPQDEKMATFPPVPRSSGEKLIRNGAQPSDGPSHVETLERHAFDHPAGYELQRIVWIPKDVHGFFQHEVDGIEAAHIEVSTAGAIMSETGKVDAVRSPPGEDWHEVEPERQ